MNGKRILAIQLWELYQFYHCCLVIFCSLPENVKGDRAKMEQAFELALKHTEQFLQNVGSLEHIQLLDFSNCFVGFTLFWLGTMMRKQNITSITEKKPFIVLAFIVLLFLNTHGVILLNQNEFTNPAFLICSALSGWIFILGIAKKLSPIDRVSNYAYYINQAAIDIMALHFIGFKAVAAVQVVIRGLPMYHLARFPILDGSNGW